jgi:hypothetical protein
VAKDPEHRLQTTETARQRAITKAQVNLISLLAAALLVLLMAA